MKKVYLTLALIAILSRLTAQGTLHGTVFDNDGTPLTNAYVYKQNSFSGTTTDQLGKFQLKMSGELEVIIISYLGFAELIDTVQAIGPNHQEFILKPSPFLADEFVVEATRVNHESSFAHQNISGDELDAINLAQDLPVLLNQSVSVVTTSDAGAGVGYTGIRIRGSDASRINVTVNGVPINDAESHGVFWVNMPDFASSINNLQIQRGVGSSSNGTGAFGASINMQTTDFDSTAYVELNNSYGSFNTHKHNAVFNSGIVNNHFNFEGRMSFIGSEGYIDRASARLRSFYFAGGYHAQNFMLKALVFSGKEITQQAWWGTPESRLYGSEQDMIDHASLNGYSQAQTENLLSSGRTYNHYLYDNEIDDYGQDHYQLITGTQIAPNLYFNLTGHYTRGKGFFEQSKPDSDFDEFGLENPIIGSDTINTTDFIVRRWLDNHFYGGVYSLLFEKKKLALTLGGSYNQYIGDHYGEIIWAGLSQDIDIRERYYFSDSKKNDLSNYLKLDYKIGQFAFIADVQYRYIDYRSQGVDNDQRPININQVYNFVNPKVGVNWRVNSYNRVYASMARASREPVRSDFTDALPGVLPKPEFLTDAELGFERSTKRMRLQVNSYFMYYQDQLVLTGEVNDVGAPIRTNVKESYRAGFETTLNVDLYNGFYWQPNATVSQNKIVKFEETVSDFTSGFDLVKISHSNTDIAFSPPLIAGSQLGYKSKFGWNLALLTKYVSSQFLDNTSNANRAIPAYWTNDVLLSYSKKTKWIKNVELNILINNILNQKYSSNGYTFSYIFGATITENFYYPQAGANWLVGLKLRF